MIPSVVARLAQDNLLDYLDTTYGLRDEAIKEALFGFLQGDAGFFRDRSSTYVSPFVLRRWSPAWMWRRRSRSTATS